MIRYATDTYNQRVRFNDNEHGEDYHSDHVANEELTDEYISESGVSHSSWDNTSCCSSSSGDSETDVEGVRRMMVGGYGVDDDCQMKGRKKLARSSLPAFHIDQGMVVRLFSDWRRLVAMGVIVLTIGSTVNSNTRAYLPTDLDNSRRSSSLHDVHVISDEQEYHKGQQDAQNLHHITHPHEGVEMFEKYLLQKKMITNNMNEHEYGEWSGVARTEEQSQNSQRGRIWDWVPVEDDDDDAYDNKKEKNDADDDEINKDVENENGNEGEEMVGTAKEKIILEDGQDLSDVELPFSPPLLMGYKNVWEPLEPGDNAVYWHIPKAGGSSIKNTLGSCHRFRLATESGIRNGHDEDTEIAIVYPQKVEGQDSTPFVNVDTTTEAGLKRAKKLGLAQSGLAEVIVTPLFHEANKIFTRTHKGRLFTIFRDPIDRAVSMFYYLQVADWETTYNADLRKMTLEEFAKSTMVEDNWMVRRLTGALQGKITEEHLDAAMKIVNDKILVGLLSRGDESMRRFEKFFRWKYRVNPPNQEKCRERLMNSGANKGTNKKDGALTEDAHRVLAYRNRLDIQLYKFIEDLFERQGNFVKDLPDDFRLQDASCAKCVPPSFPTCEPYMGLC